MSKTYTDKEVEQIEREFEQLTDENVPDEQWWEWVKGWLDMQIIVDIYKDWDLETKKQAIEEIKKLTKDKEWEIFTLSEGDITGLAKEMGIKRKLTDDELEDVAHHFKNGFDAGNEFWEETLKQAIEEVVE